jgi:hypothetical protein
MSQRQFPEPVRGRRLRLLPIVFSFFVSCLAFAQEAVSPTSDQPLTDEDLVLLTSALDELKTLAPKLRVHLRTLRTQVDFDPRQIHQIERGMSQSQKNLERLIAMSRRHAYSAMRAHFQADDLRRKSEGLKTAKLYVEGRLARFGRIAGTDPATAGKKQADQVLVDLLERYADRLSEVVALLQRKGI